MSCCRRTYACGALYALLPEEGDQLYFYRSGVLKSRLPYRAGQLHGTVRLYYPSGKLKRWIEFQEGQRWGFERVWDESGCLLLETLFPEAE